MTRHSVATPGLARSAATKATLVTRSPGRKKPQPCAGSGSRLRAASPRAGAGASRFHQPSSGPAPRPSQPRTARCATGSVGPGSHPAPWLCRLAACRSPSGAEPLGPYTRGGTLSEVVSVPFRPPGVLRFLTEPSTPEGEAQCEGGPDPCASYDPESRFPHAT